jgi:hypothetical protein
MVVVPFVVRCVVGGGRFGFVGLQFVALGSSSEDVKALLRGCEFAVLGFNGDVLLLEEGVFVVEGVVLLLEVD